MKLKDWEIRYIILAEFDDFAFNGETQYCGDFLAETDEYLIEGEVYVYLTDIYPETRDYPGSCEINLGYFVGEITYHDNNLNDYEDEPCFPIILN